MALLEQVHEYLVNREISRISKVAQEPFKVCVYGHGEVSTVGIFHGYRLFVCRIENNCIMMIFNAMVYVSRWLVQEQQRDVSWHH
jgi:hypothetical protein